MADTGGALGLFLGLSLLQIFSWFGSLWPLTVRCVISITQMVARRKQVFRWGEQLLIVFKVLKTPKCRSFPSRASHGGAEEEEHHSVNQLNILNCLPVYEKLQESQSACKFTRTTHQLFCSIASLHTVRARQIDALYLLKYPLLISEHNYALRSLSPSTSNHAQSQVLA